MPSGLFVKYTLNVWFFFLGKAPHYYYIIIIAIYTQLHTHFALVSPEN